MGLVISSRFWRGCSHLRQAKAGVSLFYLEKVLTSARLDWVWSKSKTSVLEFAIYFASMLVYLIVTSLLSSRLLSGVSKSQLKDHMPKYNALVPNG